MLEPIELGRLALTFLLAVLFGMERQKSFKPVGFGTFTFVALGACMLGIISAADFQNQTPTLLAAVVTGTGFLGAGALIKNTDRVSGFTTAASLWLFGTIGITIGIGEYGIALSAYALIWLIIWYDKRLEKKGAGSYQRKVTITTNSLVEEKSLRAHMIGSKRCRLSKVEVDKEKREMKVSYIVAGSKSSINSLVARVVKDDKVKACTVE